MTKTTEELKRAMYEYFEVARSNSARPNLFSLFEKSLEEYLEALRSESAVQAQHLGLTVQNCDILRDAYAHQQALTHAACVESREGWSENYDLKARVRELEANNDNGCRVLVTLQEQLKDMTRLRECYETLACDYTKRFVETKQERDELRNKLQAFEFANRSAAELLSEALREPSGLRKSSQADNHQESSEECQYPKCGGKHDN